MTEILTSEILVIILLLVLGFHFKRIGTIVNLAKIRLRASQWEPTSRTEIPSHTRLLFAASEAALKSFGFEYVGSLRATPPNTLDPRPYMWADLHWNQEVSVLARVEIAGAISGQATHVSFISLFDDGNALLTVNRQRWEMFPVSDRISVADQYADDLDTQWDAHRNALVQRQGVSALISDRSQVIRTQVDIGVDHWLQYMAQLGWLAEDTTGGYRFTARGAWRYSGQLVNPPAEARLALSRPYRHTPPVDIKAWRMSEMDSVAADIALSAQPLPIHARAALFILTLAISAVFFGNGFGALDAAALLLVLLIHEVGHLAAMAIFGYRNLSIFFLPLLGAAATGHKPNAPPWQEAIVLLAGPVPGLILALAALQIPSEYLPTEATEFVRSTVWFSFALNLFNLLPFGILDGGKLFELAVLGRFPRAAASFAAIGTFLGMLYAVWSRSLLLGFATLLIAAGLPLRFKAAAVVSRIRAMRPLGEIRARSGEIALRTLAKALTKDNNGNEKRNGWQWRRSIARIAYPQLLQGVPSLATSGLTLIGHALAFTVPALILITTWLQPQRPPLLQATVAEQRSALDRIAETPESIQADAAHMAFVSRYEAEADPSRQWEMLERHEEQSNNDSEISVVHWQWFQQQRTVVFEKLPASHPEKLAAELGGIPVGDGDALLSLIRRLSGHDASIALTLEPRSFNLLLEAWIRLARECPREIAMAEKPFVERIYDQTSNSTSRDIDAEHHSNVTRVLARMAIATGDSNGAVQLMRSLEPENKTRSLEYGWFLIDAGLPETALELADKTIQSAPPSGTIHWQTLAGWAYMRMGDARAADHRFLAVANERAERLRQNSEALPWWLSVVDKIANRTAQAETRVFPDTLDHIAALERYDPSAAAELKRSYSKSNTSAPAATGVNLYWGDARRAAHRRLVAELSHQQ